MSSVVSMYTVRDSETGANRLLLCLDSDLGILYMLVIEPLSEANPAEVALNTGYQGMQYFAALESIDYVPAALQGGIRVKVQYWGNQTCCAVVMPDLRNGPGIELPLHQPRELAPDAAGAFYSIVRKVHEDYEYLMQNIPVVGET